VPLTSTICGLPAPEVAMATAPLLEPVSDGVKVTLSVHLADAASAPPQGELPLPATEKFALALSELMVTELPLLLVTVMVLAALVAPIPVEENFSVVGLKLSGTAGPDLPFPESATSCGLNAPPVAMASAPSIVPSEVGANVTAMVQLDDAPSEVPQVPPVMEKSALAVELRLMAVLSLLVTVTVFDAEWPTATVPKFKLAGLNESGVVPLPVSVTSCGLVAAPSLKVSAPVTAPAILGLKVTLTVQLLLAARELEQLLVAVKSPLAVIEVMLRALNPEFVRVTVWAALVVPAATVPKLKLVGLTPAVGLGLSKT